MRSINEMNLKSGLVTLRGYWDQLANFVPKLPATQLVIAPRAREVSRSIEDLLAKLASWEEGIAQATTVQQIKILENNGIGMQGLFLGTNESANLEAKLDRCTSLRAVFEERSKLERVRPENLEDYDRLTQQLTDLRTNNLNILSPSQEATFSKAQEIFDNFVAQQTVEAEAWLQQREQELEASADSYALRTKLNSPPPFLPSACVSTLRALEIGNQRRIDEDVVGQIIESFKRIADLEQRKDCLDRLQQSLME